MRMADPLLSTDNLIHRLRRQPRFWWFAVGVWLVVLLCASSQAGIMPPMYFTWQDKVEHASYFCAGGLCFYFALRYGSPQMSVKAVCIATVLFCSLIGVSDEWHQSFVPGRSGNDVWDWTADTIGGLLAAMLGRRIK